MRWVCRPPRSSLCQWMALPDMAELGSKEQVVRRAAPVLLRMVREYEAKKKAEAERRDGKDAA